MLAWGISFIAIKFAVGEVDPVVVVWLRLTIAMLIFTIVMLARHQLHPPARQDLWYFALLGFIGITFHQLLQSIGLETSQASTTAWLVSTSPIFIALLGWLFLHEKPGLNVSLGILLAALGVLLIVSKGNLASLLNGGIGTRGDLLILLSAPNWAIFSVLSRRMLQKHPAFYMLFFVMLFGWCFTSLYFFSVQGWMELVRLSAMGWLAVAFLGVFCTALGYIFWYDGLQAIPVSQVGAFLYVEPLVAMVAAAILLGEIITLPAVLGGALILFGLWLVNHP